MKYFKHLYVQVLIGIIAGIVVGFIFPSFSPTAKIISDSFINLIKMLVIPLIFFTVVHGIAGTGDTKKLGKIGIKSIIYFEVVTTLALIIGLIVANVVEPGNGILPPNTAKSTVQTTANAAQPMNWVAFFTNIIPSNVFESFAKGDILQILFFAVLFGIAITKMGTNGNSLVQTFDKLNHALFHILEMVMKLSPIGAFGGMAYTIGKFGVSSLLVLGKLMACFYLTAFFFIAIVLQIIARLYGFSLLKLLKYIKEELLIVIGASSSEAALPGIMKKLHSAGCSKQAVGIIMPAGYSFNLDGTTIYLSMCVIFLAQVFNVPLSVWQQLTIIGILMVTSKGAAGVTGSGFIVLTSTLTILKVIPVEGLALLVGVDRFMSEARAVTNMIGNTVATVVIAKSENEINWNQYKSTVESA
ncbi:MAG: C4-dicarboxylate transporter DctA [Chitinophagaceae bacterium]